METFIITDLFFLKTDKLQQSVMYWRGTNHLMLPLIVFYVKLNWPVKLFRF